MSLAPTVEEQELLADSYRRAGSGLTARERYAEWWIGLGFVTAVAGPWVIGPPHELRIVPTVLCMAVLARATTREL